MADLNKFKRFIETFCSNAAPVLSTITNQTVQVKILQTMTFNFGKISEDIDIPGILATVSFSRDESFQGNLFLSKGLTASLADLMMLGNGDVEYSPDEHNDALQEMLNQILGSLTADLSGEGIALNGSISQVELTDMEIQREFMADNSMANIEISLGSKSYKAFFIFDSDATTSIDNLFVGFDNSKLKDSGKKESRSSGAVSSQKYAEEPTVNVSRAAFPDIQDDPVYHGNNINIDMLLDVVLPISVELGRKNMKIKQILDLGQGSVVELNKTAGEPVDLMVNGKKFAVGEVMVADENYAVRIINLVSRAERIKSLGDEE